jgi:hypothetical protein
MSDTASDCAGITFVEGASASGPDPAAREARRRQALETTFGAGFGRGFTSPFFVIEDHEIACPVGIRFFRKDFQYLSRQLYYEYLYRTWRGFDLALLDRYAAVTSAKLTAIDAGLQNNINRLQKLLEAHGDHGALTLWPAAHKVDVPIICAQARAYLAMLTRMDRLYTLSGTANLLGVIDSAQRAEVEFGCKKSVRAFRSIVQAEVAKLTREAERIVAEQHPAGRAESGAQPALRAQGETMSNGDAEPQREDGEDESSPGEEDEAGTTDLSLASA